MRRRFLRFLATFFFRYAWLMLPLVLLVTGLAIWEANRMDFDTSMVAFLPPEARAGQAVGEIISDYRKLEPVVVTINARRPVGETELISVAQEAARLLDNANFFGRPVYKVDELARDYYGSMPPVRLLQLLPASDLNELPGLLADRLLLLRNYRLNAFLPPRIQSNIERDPLGAFESIRARLAQGRGPIRLGTRNGYFISADGRAIRLLLYPVRSPEIAREASATLAFLEDSREFLLHRHAPWRELFDIEYSGSLVTTAQQLRQMRDDQQIIVAITAPLAILFILLVFRKAEAVIFILCPPALGLTWTLGLATRAFGGISLVTAAFLLIILAIGLQYSVHLYHRFVIELYRHHNYYRALSRSYVETGRGILASAVIIAVLFFALFATALPAAGGDWRGLLHLLRDTRGIAQLSLVASLAILCNLFACLLALPLMAAIKHAMARGRVKPVPLYRFRLDRFFDPAINNPRATLAILLLASVYFGYQGRLLDFYPGFASVSPFYYRTAPVETQAATDETARPGRPIIASVHGKTWQEALERNDRLYDNLTALGDNFNILSFESLRTVLPSLRTQQAALDRLTQLDLAGPRAQLTQAGAEAGLKPAVAETFLTALASLKQSAAHPDFIDYNRTDAGESLTNTVQRYITHRSDQDQDLYYVTTAIYPRADGFDPRRLTALSTALGQGIEGLNLIGDPLIERALSHLFKFNLALMILLSVAIISAGLLLHFRSPRQTWLTLLPVLAELVWLSGLMALAGLQLHFFTVLALPLVLSLAMDNAMQLTQYYHDRQPCSVRHALFALGRMAMLSGGLTALLLGTFSLARYPGVRDFGAVVLFGALTALAGTVMLLPALLQLFGRDQPVLDTLMKENES